MYSLRFPTINIIHVIRNQFYYFIKFNDLTKNKKPNSQQLGFLREFDRSTPIFYSV
jgi:negative regulator of genetic competence, sporulation and motility